MKPIKLAVFSLTLALSASAFAQPPQEGRRPEGGPGFGQGGRGRFPNPVLEAIDKDKNGELSPEEIEGAVAALKSLDKNSDGKLDQTELRPNFEGMGREGMGRGGFGGPEGRGGAGGGENAEAMVERLMASDANKDGKLSKEELPERLQSMMARGDKNEDGSLDKEEIMAIARERAAQGGGGGGFGGPGGGEGRGGEFMAQMFERADANKDGKLSGEEIPPFMRERLESIDTNKDGSLDKAELEAGMGRMREGRGGRGEGRGEGQGRGEGGRRRPDAEGEGEGDAPKKE